MRDNDLVRLRDLLGPVGKKLRLDDPTASGALWKRWGEIVGDDIARNAEPTSLKQGVLRIRTVSPTWATEMSYLANDIKQRINETLRREVVKEVKIWTSPAPIDRATERGAGHTAPNAASVGRRGRSEDPHTAFQKAFEAWSKRRNRERR